MRLALAFILLLSLSTLAVCADLPQLKGRVNDYAGLISPQKAAALEEQLRILEQSDSTQIAVLTVPNLGGENIESFSIRIAEAWKIGQKGLDNGVILIIAKDERKVRIEVGRGLEGILTDLVSGRIIRSEIAPKFKAGDIDGGITAGVNAISAAVKGEYKAAPRDLHKGKKGVPPLYTMLVFLAVAAVFLSSFSKYLAGAVGALGLPVIAWLTFPGLALAVIAVLAVGGFFLGLLLAVIFSGGGGGFGGPFFFGGGYGGGGRGGDSGGFFGGGGDFGGGGASGDW